MTRAGQRVAAALALVTLALCAQAAELPELAPATPERERPRGWFWYDDPRPKPESKRAPAVERAAPEPEVLTEDKPEFVRRFEAFQKRIKESRMRFFIDPSPENAREMAELQTALVRRASDASDLWQRVMWANPQFDFTLERPVNKIALDARDAAERASRRALFDQLANTRVLYFFFRGDCPYCHAFAPVLEAFSRATGIRVFPVSLDGGALAEYPRPVRDNGISQTLKVSTVPALFLAEPARARIEPVGYGVMSETQLASRIVAIAQPETPELQAATPTLPLRSMEFMR